MTPAVKPPKATVVDLLMRAAERLMLAAQDEGAVLRGAIDLLGDRFGYEMRYVLLWRPERKVLEMAVVGGPAADRPEVRAFTTRLGVGLTGRCAESLATVYALGHAAVVFALGVAAIVFSEQLPGSVDTVMERVVGLTLVALGAYVIVSLARHGRDFRISLPTVGSRLTSQISPRFTRRAPNRRRC